MLTLLGYIIFSCTLHIGAVCHVGPNKIQGGPTFGDSLDSALIGVHTYKKLNFSNFVICNAVTICINITIKIILYILSQ